MNSMIKCKACGIPVVENGVFADEISSHTEIVDKNVVFCSSCWNFQDKTKYRRSVDTSKTLEMYMGSETTFGVPKKGTTLKKYSTWTTY